MNVLRCKAITFLEVLKNKNPLTAKVAKNLRKGHKELNNNVLTLRTLRLLCVLCG